MCSGVAFLCGSCNRFTTRLVHRVSGDIGNVCAGTVCDGSVGRVKVSKAVAALNESHPSPSTRSQTRRQVDFSL